MLSFTFFFKQGDAELAHTEEARSVDVDDESDNNNNSEGEEQEQQDKVTTAKRRHRRSVGDTRVAKRRERILRKHPLSIRVTIE